MIVLLGLVLVVGVANLGGSYLLLRAIRLHAGETAPRDAVDVMLAPSAPVIASRSEQVFRKNDPRFYIQAVDTNGNETDESWRGDDESEAKRMWRYFNEGKQKGTFTLWDQHHAGHRGQFSRGLS